MPPRWCFIPSAPSLPGFVRLHGVCVFVCMRRTAISFCTKPAVDSPATDTGSSLEPHTVFHSINFCPPPWAHFTGVNSSPPLGWVCEPVWMCAPARSRSILIEVKSEMFWDSPPRDLWVLWWIKRAPPKKHPREGAEATRLLRHTPGQEPPASRSHCGHCAPPALHPSSSARTRCSRGLHTKHSNVHSVLAYEYAWMHGCTRKLGMKICGKCLCAQKPLHVTPPHYVSFSTFFWQFIKCCWGRALYLT